MNTFTKMFKKMEFIYKGRSIFNFSVIALIYSLGILLCCKNHTGEKII